MKESYDYVIVGAGSAGCVLAARLTEDAHVSVLLLEAGGPDYRWDWRLHMPAALAHPMNGTRYDWGFRTEPQGHLAGRRLHWPRGKVLGGSSSINGMAYVRGNALDFEGWAAEPGLEGWRYAAVLPYFKRSESYDLGGDAYRGDGGPLHVTAGRGWSPLHHAFVAAGLAAGYGHTADMNGYRQEGFGRMDMTVHRGSRWSAARAFLHPVRHRRNLTVATGAHAARLHLAGSRCTGVAYRQGSREHTVHAAREVILAAGALGSPQLLLLSGIGSADELAQVGIACRHHLPGVGRNLQDHLELYVQERCRQPVTLYPTTRLLDRLATGLRWLATGTGWGATNHFETGAFVRSGDEVPWPDLQFHFLPMAVRYDGRGAYEGHGYQVHVGPMRSKSRGWLRLASDRHDRAPVLQPNAMSHADDRVEMRRAVRIAREVFAQTPFAAFSAGELSPGVDVRSDAGLDAYVAANAESAYHPCGTCRMGSGPDAVVDGALRVHGLEALRVVDASIMPTITTGNLNAPTLMIAEKASDLVRGRSEAPSNAPFYRVAASLRPAATPASTAAIQTAIEPAA